jgi:casein kinase II subunit alpha
MLDDPRHEYHEITQSRIYADVNSSLPESRDHFSSYQLIYGDIDRYEILLPIGTGKYSHVFLGKVDGTRLCAIKILKPTPFYKIQKEIAVLEKLKAIPNVIELLDVLQDPQSRSILIVTEYQQFTRPKDLYPSVTLNDIRYLMYNVLLTLDLSHRAGVMHRDVKPENLILSADRKSLKMIDWGLADLYFPLHRYNTRVSTLRYKAPELLLRYEYYDYGVDVWGAGCVFGELLVKIPFFEGRTPDEMVANIAALCGFQTVVNYVERYGLSVPAMAITLLPPNPSPTWHRLFGIVRSSKKDEQAFDLLKRLLTVDHNDRITAREALEHPFFEAIRDEMEQKLQKECLP